MSNGRFWIIILAAGDGTRVRSLTTDSAGRATPKQFFAPDGRRSMLRWTIDRAKCFVSEKRIVVVVAGQHRTWWKRELADLPPDNIVVQPLNRGTAAGVLLPLLQILRRDPMASVLVLPSDHHVKDEAVLCDSILESIRLAKRQQDRLVLLGMPPNDVDRDYGWIVPGDALAGEAAREVALFVEKPDRSTASTLARRGALWNSFIFVAGARVLLSLYEERAPLLLSELLRTPGARISGVRHLDRVYETLPSYDFSRDLIEPSPDRLLVYPVPNCGWSDLGTPARLEQFRSGPAREVADATVAADVSTLV